MIKVSKYMHVDPEQISVVRVYDESNRNGPSWVRVLIGLKGEEKDLVTHEREYKKGEDTIRDRAIKLAIRKKCEIVKLIEESRDNRWVERVLDRTK